jgi:hypothetical protein
MSHLFKIVLTICLPYFMISCIEEGDTKTEVTITGNLTFDPSLCFEQADTNQCEQALDQSHVCAVIKTIDTGKHYMIYGELKNKNLDIPGLKSVSLNVGEAFQSALYFYQGSPSDCDVESSSELAQQIFNLATCSADENAWCQLKLFQDESIYRENKTVVYFTTDLNTCSIESSLAICQSINCGNARQDDLEGGVDCGGICEPCEQYCLKNEDCESKICILDDMERGKCTDSTCNDGVVNQQETSIDCGGPNCPKCSSGFDCTDDSQCEVKCIEGICCGDDDYDLICNQFDLCPMVEDEMGDLYNLSQKAYFTSLGYAEGDENKGIHCSDFDEDGVFDINDNCPLHSNGMQENRLGGLSKGDACDDQDGDGIFDLVDNCLNIINPDQSDVDTDQMGDFCDLDIDNDGKVNGEDNDQLNRFICIDEDMDFCDECASGQFTNRLNDGDDLDEDGLCDLGDPDIDNDGKHNTEDSDQHNSSICSDLDLDTCDDCSRGLFDLNNDGDDFDRDGLCDQGDNDTDNDGKTNDQDWNPMNFNQCSDDDHDTCDDCSSSFFNPNNDGDDIDRDGICNIGDSDIDNDGKTNDLDLNPTNANECSDIDQDRCDDCTRGSFNTNNDGDDVDGDGICNVSDPDSDNDGVNDVDEKEPMAVCKPQTPNECRSNVCMQCTAFDAGFEYVVICWCD